MTPTLNQLTARRLLVGNYLSRDPLGSRPAPTARGLKLPGNSHVQNRGMEREMRTLESSENGWFTDTSAH